MQTSMVSLLFWLRNIYNLCVPPVPLPPIPYTRLVLQVVVLAAAATLLLVLLILCHDMKDGWWH
jgi:hypothetical protein